MEYIHRLPFLLSALMAIMVGIISYKLRVSQQDTYLRMAICMVVFYAFGVFSRNMIIKIIDDIEKRKQQEEIEKAKELEIQMQEEMHAIENPEQNVQPHQIDYRIDDYGEDFSPLTVSEIYKSDINK